jgi:hypothetical protein
LVTERPLTEELRTLLAASKPSEYVRLNGRLLIGLAQVIGAHPVIDFIGEATSPATKLVHFGRTLERTE